MDSRIVCHFSCGAASEVATKLAISKYGHEPIVIYNAFIVEDHQLLDDTTNRFRNARSFARWPRMRLKIG